MTTATVTISIATAALAGWIAHGFSAGQKVWFAPIRQPIGPGALPAPVLPGILYFVIAPGLVTDAFQFAATAGGTAINTTGATQFGAITGTSTSSVLNNFVPPMDPSSGTKTKPVLKLKEADFGDGYTQVTRDGLNHIRRVTTMQWDVLQQAQADMIERFFETQGGDTPFYYALRGDITRKWTCKDWDRERGSVNKLSATLREDFSLRA